MAERKCQGTNASGEPCQNPAVGLDGWCDAHRPGNEGEMRRRALKGAIASRRAKGLGEDELGPLSSHEDAKRWLETIGRAVASGRLGDRAAQAAIKAVSEWVKAEGERLSKTVLDELRAEIDELKAEMQGNGRRLRPL